MIRLSQVKLPISHSREELEQKAAKALKISPGQIKGLQIIKQSIDARKRDQVTYSYVLDIQAEQEEKIIKRAKNRNAVIKKETSYRFPSCGKQPLSAPPVIIGTGPAGLFCGLMLARAGYRPILLERGGPVEERKEKVDTFWNENKLDPQCNVQFGEGGAGTFSDGKLNTLVKDISGRNGEVLRIFTEFGADPSICYVNKPHIGTDVLSEIVSRIRKEIIRLGGQVRFHACVTDFLIQEETDGGRAITGVLVNHTEKIESSAVVLAIGHSARDTFQALYEQQIPMEPKAFAVGLRIQHPQEMIDESQYGREAAGILGAASYKLTYQAGNGRGVYTFCMCPGGYVVNASSEEGHLAVNGMSNHARDGENANSAVIVTVTPEDFGGNDKDPLAGVEFQRRLEEKAFKLGQGLIPVQLYGDFKEDRESGGFGGVNPQFCGKVRFANLRTLLPEDVTLAMVEGIDRFGQIIKGFDRPDGILAGIESRTSSPIRIPRNEEAESPVRGLYPCGEGAGYAGGITSAAMDGIRTAECLAKRFRPF